MSMKGIRVRCQRPGCQQRTVLAIDLLPEISARTSMLGTDAMGWVVTAMIVIEGWGFGLDQDGVLYGICPADAAEYSLKKGPPGSAA